MFRPSSFFQDLVEEGYDTVLGVNELLTEKKLAYGDKGVPQTDYSDGVSYINGGVSSDGFGYGRMCFDTTGILSGLGRGLSLFQYHNDPTKFLTVQAWQNSGAAATQDTVVTRWKFNDTAAIATLVTRSASNFSAMPTHVGYSGYDLYADGISFLRLNASAALQAAVIYQPSAPTLPSTSGVGLTGYYAWCFTLIDASGNESQPSALVASGNLANVGQVVSIGDTTAYVAAGWVTARFYRTLTSAAAITADDNPTFYHLTGKDTTLTSTTQTITDAVADATLTNPNNYRLTNVAYAEGSLRALATNMVPKFISTFQGVPVGANWNDGTNTYPRRVYWGFVSDNSGTAAGNATSWNNQNYEDVGNESDGAIIGVFPGLQGRFYIFLESATYLMEATGSDIIPYSFTPISNDYGFFHHSVDDAGNHIYGRTKTGLFRFDGSRFDPIGKPMSRTLARCVFPEADSGVFDPITKRYYLSVCDSGIPSSLQYAAEGSGGSAGVFKTTWLKALRNSVMIYDETMKTWEVSRKTPIQVFARLRDSHGVEGIFALGMSSEILTINEWDLCGAAFSVLATIGGSLSSQFSVGVTIPNGFIGRRCYVPYVYPSDGTSVSFTRWMSDITAIPSTSIRTADPAPTQDTSYRAMLLADAASGVIDTGSGSDLIIDAENYFTDPNIKFYSVTSHSPTNLNLQATSISSINSYALKGSTNQRLTFDNVLPTFTAGDIYTIEPYRMFNNALLSGDIAHYRDIVLPPFGMRSKPATKKMFEALRLHIKGSGTLRIDTYFDGEWTILGGQPTPSQTQIITLASGSDYVQRMVYFTGTVAWYMRVRLRMVRGYGRLNLQDFIAYYRLQEALTNE